MTKAETMAIRKYVEGAYNQVKTNNDSDLVWFDMLKDYDYQIMLKNLKDYIKSGNKYAPNLADLIGMYKPELLGENKKIFDLLEQNGFFDDESGDKEVAEWNRKNRIRKVTNWLLDIASSPSWFKEIYHNTKNDKLRLNNSGNQ